MLFITTRPCALTSARIFSCSGLLEGAEVLLPSLEDVHERLQALVVERNLYELTATNLRSALGITGEVTLDQARGSDAVYRYCMANPDAYLDAVENDSETEYSLRTPETLAAVLTAAESWDEETIERLTTTASSESTLPMLDDAPATTWKALSAATLFRASLANVEAYRAEVGIDKSLGELLLSAGAIHIDEPDADERPDKAAAAVAVLNAGSAIPSPEDRVKLLRSLDLNGRLRPRRSRRRRATCSRSSSGTNWSPTTRRRSPTSAAPAGRPSSQPSSPRPEWRSS